MGRLVLGHFCSCVSNCSHPYTRQCVLCFRQIQHPPFKVHSTGVYWYEQQCFNVWILNSVCDMNEFVHFECTRFLLWTFTISKCPSSYHNIRSPLLSANVLWCMWHEFAKISFLTIPPFTLSATWRGLGSFRVPELLTFLYCLLENNHKWWWC